MNHVTQICACGKVYGIDEQDAKRILRRIQKLKGTANCVRYYSCQFGGWHWTQQLNQQKRTA